MHNVTTFWVKTESIAVTYVMELPTSSTQAPVQLSFSITFLIALIMCYVIVCFVITGGDNSKLCLTIEQDMDQPDNLFIDGLFDAITFIKWMGFV